MSATVESARGLPFRVKSYVSSHKSGSVIRVRDGRRVGGPYSYETALRYAKWLNDGCPPTPKNHR